MELLFFLVGGFLVYKFMTKAGKFMSKTTEADQDIQNLFIKKSHNCEIYIYMTSGERNTQNIFCTLSWISPARSIISRPVAHP